MAQRKLRLENDEILRKVSKPVKIITPRIITLLDDMAETLEKADGIGLAAPQVGVLKRIVVIRIDDNFYEIIDPKIIESRGSQRREEGCLSIPGESGIVERPEYVKVKYTDRMGGECTVEGTELLAVALCHEIDHLDGILYIDKLIDDSEADS